MTLLIDITDKTNKPVSNENRIFHQNFNSHSQQTGARGGAVVEALRYKPEGRGFDSR
jgi:hypothetical protein